MSGTAVAQVIAINTGDDHVFEFQCGDGFGEVPRLIRVRRLWPAMGDVAERATPCAEVTENHESRGTFAETLTDVRAGGLLAHGVQFLLTQDLFDFLETFAVTEA